MKRLRKKLLMTFLKSMAEFFLEARNNSIIKEMNCEQNMGSNEVGE